MRIGMFILALVCGIDLCTTVSRILNNQSYEFPMVITVVCLITLVINYRMWENNMKKTIKKFEETLEMKMMIEISKYIGEEIELAHQAVEQSDIKLSEEHLGFVLSIIKRSVKHVYKEKMTYKKITNDDGEEGFEISVKNTKLAFMQLIKKEA